MGINTHHCEYQL